MSIIGDAAASIRGRGLRLALPEAGDSRIREAAARLAAEGLAKPLIIAGGGAAPPDLVAVIRARRPKMTEAMAGRLLARPLYLAGAMVAAGQADAMLAGAANPTARVIEAALMTIGLADGVDLPSSFFLMQWPERRLIFADCAVNVQPASDELASIAISSAASAQALLREEPRVALLSFSTKGSGPGPESGRVAEAAAIANRRAPHLKIDGELQGDAALSEAVAARKLTHLGEVAGRANVLVFPDLDAGNIAYKLVQYLSGAQAVGPILQGFARPVSDLSRGATVDDVIATAVILLAMAHRE